MKPAKLFARLRVTEMVLCGVMLVIFLWLFSELLARVGGLWRDEVGSVWIVQRDTWRWMLGLVREDSFPPLFNCCLRIWMMLGGASDGWLQSWGYVTAAALVPALWWSARSATRPVPLLAIALLYFNPTVFYWGHSVRAYGLATILAVLFFGALWRLLERPDRRNFALASVVAILNAQASYQNAPLLLAISLSAAIVTGARRQWRQAALLLVPGFLAALSLLIHLPAIRYVGQWNIMIRQSFGLGWIWERMCEALGSAGTFFVWLWAGLLVALGCYAVRGWVRDKFEREEVRVFTYGFMAAVLAVLLVFGFALQVGYPTQEWYYVAFMGLLAVAFEFGFSPLLGVVAWRWVRLALALTLVAGSVGKMWQRAQVRRTNVDLIADKMRLDAGPKDLILIRPFYCGMVFQHYYRGSTPWTTIPPIAWSEMHNCYDTVRQYVKQNEPLGSTLERIAVTLRGGGRVFFVGGLQLLQEGARPPASPPAPHPQYGWSDEVYSTIWAMQAGYFVQMHGKALRVVPVPCEQEVQKFENLPVIEVSGWRE